MNKTLIALIAFGIGLAVPAGVQAELREQASGQDRHSPFMQEFGQALPPIGHVGFCRRNPAECVAEPTLHQLFELSAEREQEMREINALVNEVVKPVTDQELYGRIEHWTYPAGKGDCEDYVLLKRRLLMERGWPASALLITVVRDENGDGHAILTVRTDKGDFLLDNKHSQVITWNQSPYQFVKRQSHWDPQAWVSLKAPSLQHGDPTPVARTKRDRIRHTARNSR